MKADVGRSPRVWSYSRPATSRLPPKPRASGPPRRKSVSQLDRATILASVRKTRRLLVVHEAIKRGGYGGEIAALVAEEAFDDLDAPPRRLAGVDTPIPYAAHLERAVVPQVEDIVRVAKELVG